MWDLQDVQISWNLCNFKHFVDNSDQFRGLYELFSHIWASLTAAGPSFGTFPWFSKVVSWTGSTFFKWQGCSKLAMFWYCLEQSYHPPVLCAGSQEHLLSKIWWSFWCVDCASCGLIESSKVRGMSGRIMVFLTCTSALSVRWKLFSLVEVKCFWGLVDICVPNAVKCSKAKKSQAPVSVMKYLSHYITL